MGHSVLLVPVPPLEAFVVSRWQHYDPAWVSTDPAFAHAHVTLLAPFLSGPDLSPRAVGRVAEIARSAVPFDFRLAELGTFPNGVVHLKPDPAGPFRDLTARLCAAFPQCPPYAGEFPDPEPHLTLDLASEEVTERSTRAALAGTLPVSCRAERVQLAWYEEGRCHVVAQWRLGEPAPERVPGPQPERAVSQRPGARSGSTWRTTSATSG